MHHKLSGLVPVLQQSHFLDHIGKKNPEKKNIEIEIEIENFSLMYHQIYEDLIKANSDHFQLLFEYLDAEGKSNIICPTKNCNDTNARKNGKRSSSISSFCFFSQVSSSIIAI